MATPTAASAAEVHLAKGIAAREGLEWPRARDELEQALALFESDRNWEGYVRARNLLGVVAGRQGDHKVALEHANAALADGERAIRILVPVYGERHDMVVQTYNVIGSALTKKGDAARSL